MLIPVRCFSCGNMLADKWQLYEQLLEQLQGEVARDDGCADGSADGGAPTKSVEGRLLDIFGLTLPCCRTHFLTNVDAMDEL